MAPTLPAPVAKLIQPPGVVSHSGVPSSACTGGRPQCASQFLHQVALDALEGVPRAVSCSCAMHTELTEKQSVMLLIPMMAKSSNQYSAILFLTFYGMIHSTIAYTPPG